MERPMSIVLAYETNPATNKAQVVPEVPAVSELNAAPEQGKQISIPSTQQRDADLENAPTEHPMRLPSFVESCPHVRDQIIAMNGGHFNVDHYLRVLRARVELDVSIAVSLTTLGKQKTATSLLHRSTPAGEPHHFGSAP